MFSEKELACLKSQRLARIATASKELQQRRLLCSEEGKPLSRAIGGR